jgi:hypothetical protein
LCVYFLKENSPKSVNTTVDNSANYIDQQTTNILNSLNSMGNGQAIQIGGNQAGQNVQYYFAMPANGMQNGTVINNNGVPMQLQGLPIQGLQSIQALQNIQTIQGLQGIQGIQGLQGAQILLSSNGQPTMFSVGNRDC